MNRAERRRAQKKEGKTFPKEPTLQIKRSALESTVKSQMQVMSDDAKRKATEAAIHEIDRQILERDEAFSLDVDAMILWTLHHHYGWGKKRLLDFYKALVEEHTKMREYYQMDDTYPERYHLKNIGVDVEQLNREMIEGWHEKQDPPIK